MNGARDPGVQPERTRLAWRRTTLAAGVVGLLLVRQALIRDAGIAGYGGLAVALLTVLLLAGLAHRRLNGLGAARPAPLGPPAAGAVAACTLVLAAVGVVML
ncbi:DUF202 domain-containing protein [Streptomyces sp. WMMC897]|uniref:DUF202 domain-containing protein n=1 Tax=Streptomyces sp. WMMC897 TaxID=3014782 RepID=UPI0022B5E548|nr:DUF202 domain-containing protein [Streptomyces sp. WMMC897]MCZ7413462.1 DUF202 domain-containing protein [Streptomyces sp. WMMC897]